MRFSAAICSAKPKASIACRIPASSASASTSTSRAEAWRAWVGHQTMLMNEYRLSPIEPKARKFLVEEMEKFLFGGGATRPEGYVDPSTQG